MSAAPQSKPQKKQSTPRPRPFHRDKTRTQIAAQLRNSKSWSKLPRAWCPDIGRITTGATQMCIVLAIFFHTRSRYGRAESEWTDDLLVRDVANEFQLSYEGVRDEFEDLIERGVIARNAEHPHRYRLLDHEWPKLKRPVEFRKPCSARTEAKRKEAEAGEQVAPVQQGKGEAKTEGATAPPRAAEPPQLLLPYAEPKIVANIVSTERTYPVSCRNRTSLPLLIMPTITGAGDMVFEIQPPPVDRSAAELVTGLAERGLPVAQDFAARIMADLSSTPLPHFFRVLDEQIVAARTRRKTFMKAWLPQTARDAAGQWPAIAELEQRRAQPEPITESPEHCDLCNDYGLIGDAIEWRCAGEARSAIERGATYCSCGAAELVRFLIGEGASK